MIIMPQLYSSYIVALIPGRDLTAELHEYMSQEVKPNTYSKL